MDSGPWSFGYSTIRGCFYVESDDFEHDVRLYISGDFADDDQQRRYAEWLVSKLDAGRRPHHVEASPNE